MGYRVTIEVTGVASHRFPGFKSTVLRRLAGSRYTTVYLRASDQVVVVLSDWDDDDFVGADRTEEWASRAAIRFGGPGWDISEPRIESL